MGFYQLSSIKVQSAAAAIRAAWSTVNNWRFRFDFLNYRSSAYPCLNLGALANDFLSPPHWDSPPFAVNLAHANAGIVFNGIKNFSKDILSVKHNFLSSDVDFSYKKKFRSILLLLLSLLFTLITFFTFHILKLTNKNYCFLLKR